MERILMKLEVYKQELAAEHNAAMAKKVQLEEQKEVNDCNIQRIIGALDAVTKAQTTVNELRQADADIGGLELKKESLVASLEQAAKKADDGVKAIKQALGKIESEKTTGGST